MVEGDARWPVVAAQAASSKKAENTVVLAVGEVMAITDYFVITSGSNSRQVRTIADEVERLVVEAGGPKPIRVEGREDMTWVLLDYGDFVVHVFLEETRRYYELERLWGDVPRIEWDDGQAKRVRVAAE